MLADSRSVHTERFAKELRCQGCEVLVASIEKGHVSHFQLSRSTQSNTFTYVLSLPRLKRAVAEFKPDVINAHFASGYGFLLSLLRKRRGLPHVVHLWGSDILVAARRTPLHRFKVRRALRNADHVVADSRYLAEEAKALCTRRPISVIPWGIEERLLAYHRQDYAFNRPLKIIVPRAHEKIYNNIFIVTALAGLIRQRRIEVVFPTVGTLFESFCARAARLVGDKLRFYEPLPRESFIRFMASHDVYLSASNSDSSPVSLIEAMALGLVPVATDIPGVREWLGPENGFVFRGSDGVDLANRIGELVNSGDTFESMRRTNLEKVRRFGVFEKNMTSQIRLMNELRGDVAV